MVEVSGTSGGPLVQPPFPSRAIYSRLPMLTHISKDRISAMSPGNVCQCFSSLKKVRKHFLTLRGDLLFFSLNPLLFVCHWHHWRSLTSFSFHPPCKYFHKLVRAATPHPPPRAFFSPCKKGSTLSSIQHYQLLMFSSLKQVVGFVFPQNMHTLWKEADAALWMDLREGRGGRRREEDSFTNLQTSCNWKEAEIILNYILRGTQHTCRTVKSSKFNNPNPRSMDVIVTWLL